MTKSIIFIPGVTLSFWFLLSLLAALPVFAHCDTLDGPVVGDARKALAAGDVTPVLKWVSRENEGEIKEAFKQTLAVRGKSPEAQQLADTWFFETLVRIHRAGEGAPFTGLKPAGAEVEPAVVAADKALESGDVEPLVKMVTGEVGEGIRRRFRKSFELKKDADRSVEDGRAFVESYVQFIHYGERIYLDAIHGVAHHQAEGGEAHKD